MYYTWPIVCRKYCWWCVVFYWSLPEALLIGNTDCESGGTLSHLSSCQAFGGWGTRQTDKRETNGKILTWYNRTAFCISSPRLLHDLPFCDAWRRQVWLFHCMKARAPHYVEGNSGDFTVPGRKDSSTQYLIVCPQYFGISTTHLRILVTIIAKLNCFTILHYKTNTTTTRKGNLALTS